MERKLVPFQQGGGKAYSELALSMHLQTLVLLLAVMGPITEAKAPWFQIGYGGGGLGTSARAHISFQRVTGIKDNEPDPSVQPRWEADLFLESSDLGGTVRKSRRRADGRSCPGVAASIKLLSAIPALTPRAARSITEPWAPVPPADGVGYFFNRYGQIPGSDTLLNEGVGDASGHYLSPIWNEVSASLKPCWEDVADDAS